MFIAAVGYVITNSLSDWLGRIRTFRGGMIVLSALGLAAYWVDN